MSEKLKREEAKLQKQIEDKAKKEFSLYTVQLHDLNTKTTNTTKKPDIIYSINDEIDYLLKNNKELLYSRNRIKSSLIHNYLFTGKFNSIIGVEGLRLFKEALMEIDYSSESFEMKSNVYKKLIYNSGLFFEYEEASESLKKFYDEHDHRTIHRILLTKFTDMEYENLSKEELARINLKYAKGINDKDMEILIKAIDLIFINFKDDFHSFIKHQRDIKPNSLRKISKVS